MKVAICLASLAILAGLISAAPRPFAWDDDTVYTYQVQSRFAAGMLGLDGPTVEDTQTPRALIELTWRLNVYRSQKDPNSIFMDPIEPKAVIAKENIHPREEPISSQEQVALPKKYQELLEKGMIVKLDPASGVPKSILLYADQPLTATEKNIKRAQVQAFIMNPGTAKLIVKGNLNRQTNSVNPSEEADDSGFFYKVMEQGIHGECPTYYTVSQTGPFQSLYQFEGQDVPVQGQSSESQEQQQQHRNRNPKFAHLRSQPQSNENDDEQLSWPEAYKTFCKQGDQIYVVQKTVNLTACKERPVLATMMPAEYLQCRPGDNNCGSLWTHVVNTRFLGCGVSRYDFTIMEINQEERFVYGLRAEENLDGFAVKNITLQQKVKVSSYNGADQIRKEGKTQYEIRDMVFEFDLKEQQEQFGNRQQQSHNWQRQSQSHHGQQSSESNEGPVGTHGRITFPLENQHPSLESPPLRPKLISTIVSQEQLKQRARELVQMAAHNIVDPHKSIAEGETIAIQSMLAKAISYMEKREILNLYETVLSENQHDLELQVTVQNILCDAIVAAGTNPAMVAMLYLIEQEKIPNLSTKAPQLIMTFPHYTRHPTKDYLKRFEQFIQHEVVKRNVQLRTTALLSYSALLHQVCINARTKQSSYSYALYGPFCQVEDTEPFVDHAIGQLTKVLGKRNSELKAQGLNKNHEVSLYLAVLGNVGHPKMIKIVQQILDDSNDVQEKSKAIYSLKHLIRSHDEVNPQQHSNGRVDTEQNQNEVDRVETDPIDDEVVEKKVLPLLMSVALDKTEHPTVRIAAIQMLVYCSYADVTVWQQLAMSTWFTHSQEVQSFIVSTLKSLAEQQVGPTRVHQRMIIKARAVLPLAKPLDEDNYSRSTNSFGSGKVPHLNSQFWRQTTWIGSRDSALPTSIYFRNYLLFGDCAGVNPIEASFHFRTLSKIVDQVRDNFGSSSSEESGEKNTHMKQILDSIMPRQMKESPHGSIYINFRNGMQRLWQIDDLEKYLNMRNIANWLALRRSVPFNYQKTIQLAHQTINVPTILGLPMSFKLRLPFMVSFRGRVGINGQSQNIQWHGQVDAVAGYKRHIKIALKVPFLQRKIETGIQSHLVAQVPFRFTFRQRSDEPVVFAITPTNNINGTNTNGNKIELLTFHRIPYVAIITDELRPAVSTQGGEMTVIRTVTPATTSESHAENVLGFSFAVKEVSDYRQEKESPSAWARFLRRFRTAETFTNLGYFGGNVAKYATRKVILNVDASQSKTLVFLLAAKRGSGSIETGFDTDVSSSSSSSSSTSESDSSDSSSSSEEKRTLRQSQTGQSQSSSSSSSSSESNENSNSNEDSKEIFRSGRVIVVALLTKKQEIPVVTRTDGLVNMIKSDSPNQDQVIFQVSKRTDKFFFRYAQGAAAEEAARSLPTEDSKSMKKLADAVIEPNYQGQQSEFCSEVSGKLVYPKWATPRLLVVLRNTLLNRELKVDVQGRLQFGQTCKTNDLRQNEITVSGELQRGRNMTEWARTKSIEAQKCEQDENKGFAVSDDCLAVAFQQASALNRARLNIQWTDNLPEAFQQTMYTGRDLIKAMYMSHVYHDRFPQSPATGNSAIVQVRVSPDAEFWHANVLTNETELHMRNIPSNQAIQAVFPLSAIQPWTQNVQDTILGSDSQPTCQLQGRYISTFDNVVGRFNPKVAQGCYHLLTADASGEKTMAIFVKNAGTDSMKVKIILSQHKILLSGLRNVQRSRLAEVEEATDVSVMVNGKPIALPYTARKEQQRGESNDYVARFQSLPSGGIQILTPDIAIAYDREQIVIFGSDTFRNQTVGMCGDFDGERVGDRRSRNDIPLSTPTHVYANYAYPSEEGQCTVEPWIKQQIQEEESLVQSRRRSGNNLSNLRWGNAQFSRGQQRSQWQNRTPVRPTFTGSSSSSEEQQDRRQSNKYNQHNRH